MKKIINDFVPDERMLFNHELEPERGYRISKWRGSDWGGGTEEHSQEHQIIQASEESEECQADVHCKRFRHCISNRCVFRPITTPGMKIYYFCCFR